MRKNIHKELPNYVGQLPYPLPHDTQEIADRLARIIGIQIHWVNRADRRLVETLAGVVLLKFLPEVDQHHVLQQVTDYESTRPELAAQLREKIADGLVNPDWSLWSESTEHLEKVLADDSAINSYISDLGHAGVGFSVKNVGDYYRMVKYGQGLIKGNALSMLVGFVFTITSWLNKLEIKKLKAELKNRMPKPESSSYYLQSDDSD